MEFKTSKLAQNFGTIISFSDEELVNFASKVEFKTYKKKDIISKQGDLVNEVYFIEEGMIRFCTTDKLGNVHTTHFAVENQFLADYSALITDHPAKYTVEALEDTVLVKITNEVLDWFYTSIKDGEKFGRNLWEYYYQYLDNRLHHSYTLTPKERYDNLETVFPGIHQRVPQHMVASYIGISKVHLSRIKKES